MTANEDFLFAQEAVAQGFVTTGQVAEALLLQKRMSEELRIDERVGVILVKRGWLAEDQARRIEARVSPPKGEPGQIQGYRLLEIVGRGAMGTVYRAIHLGLQRTVAIKILRQDLAGDRTQIERLRAEAEMLASLDHPNVVRALDAGESNGFPYVVMEFVEGETLRDRMRRDGPLPERTALEIARGVADALERARRMGVVHRDVKPGNILLTREGVPKLMDLGLAKGPIDLGLTQHGSTVGTPQYIAPEQAVDPRSADTRSDIYALGATLYAMLTGRPPHDGATLAEILTKVLYETPAPVRSLRPEISREAGYLVERMMLRDPSLRYRTPALVVADIDRLIGGSSILPKGFSGNWEAYLVKRRWRRLAIAVPAAAVLVVGAVLGTRAWSERQADAEDRAWAERGLDETVPAVLPVTDARADVERRRATIRALVSVGRASRAGNVAEAERREATYSAELVRFDALERTEAEAGPSLVTGRFRDAEEIFAGLTRRFASESGYGPARRATEERVRRLRSDSDEALADARRRTFAAVPRDVEDLVRAVEGWKQVVDDRFAATAARAAEATDALYAVDVVREIRDVLRSALSPLTDEAIARRVADLELAALRRDLAAARARLDQVRETSAVPRLVVPRYVLVDALDALVTAPLAARAQAVEAAVADAWGRVRAAASARTARGDVLGAITDVERFERAASDAQAFPEVAAAARAVVGERREQALAAARTRDASVARLASDVADALSRRDVGAVRAALAAARAAPSATEVPPEAFAAFDELPVAWERLYDRAAAGLAARIGRAEERWVDSLAFEGLAAPERRVEVRAVDPVGRTVTYVSHSGGFERAAQTRRIDELSVDDLRVVGGLSMEVAADALAVAVHRFDAVADRAANPFAAFDAYQALVDALGHAGALETPLGLHVRERAAALRVEVDALEALARTAWKSAEKRVAEGRAAEAMGFLGDLLDGPYRTTRHVRDARDRIEALRERAFADVKRDTVKLASNGARVERRGGGEGLDVTMTFDFDTPEQLRSFAAGSGRLVPPGPGRLGSVTPDRDVPDQSLMLLPDVAGEIVRDRPLVLPTMMDPSVDVSVSFVYWPLAPFFLGIDVDGVQVGIVSADPQALPLPKASKDEPTTYAHFGLGRGVRFHVGSDFADPARWGWGDEFQGRRFVPPQLARRDKELLGRRYFAFESRERPYRVRMVRLAGGRGARLEVDDVVVLAEEGEAFKIQRPSGRIQILTYTRCLIDDLAITGRISKPWFEQMSRRIRGVPPPPPTAVPPAPEKR